MQADFISGYFIMHRNFISEAVIIANQTQTRKYVWDISLIVNLVNDCGWLDAFTSQEGGNKIQS